MPAISVCMIVKNEKKNISRCLDSVHGIADEIIIADTGSADRTKEIASKYTDKIFDFPWSGDFSKARNYSVEKAKGDWILWIDADEEVELINVAALTEYLENTENDLVSVRMVNFYGEEPADENHAYFSSAFRLFRNKQDYRFKGRLHEQLDADGIHFTTQSEYKDFFKILHYGYMDTANKEKINRNIEILIEEKENHPEDGWIHYHLSAEYYRSKEFGKAFSYVNQAIICFLKNGLMPPALLYKLKYDILTTTQSYESIINGIEKAIALYPDYVDLHFYKGIAQLAHKQYKEASQTFSHCLILGESNPEYLILSGSGSFFALYYLGISLEKQKEYEQAAESYNRAISHYPEFTFAKERLNELKKLESQSENV